MKIKDKLRELFDTGLFGDTIEEVVTKFINNGNIAFIDGRWLLKYYDPDIINTICFQEIIITAIKGKIIKVRGVTGDEVVTCRIF